MDEAAAAQVARPHDQIAVVGQVYPAIEAGGFGNVRLREGDRQDTAQDEQKLERQRPGRPSDLPAQPVVVPHEPLHLENEEPARAQAGEQPAKRPTAPWVPQTGIEPHVFANFG